jgi:peptidoglycan/xylan/chitin deacetylase (PgdA/CDA1 family)
MSGPWPNGRLGAVSLTFDDGRASQLEHAIPIMAQHGLLGTFYLNPRGTTEDEWRARLEPWRAVQAAGHEIGNHSQSHVCSHGFRDERGSPNRPSLEVWTLEDVEADVLEAERRLQAALPVPAGTQRTFCYPCYQEFIGQGATRQSYVPVIARHFLAARGMGEVGANRPATCDLHYLWSTNVELMDGAQLVGLAERAALGAAGQWVILTFHDVGRDSRLSNTADAFRELCAFLARHRDRLWTAPVSAVAQRVLEWRQERA